MDPKDETDLLARCRRGDAAAWDQVFHDHYAPVGRFLTQLASDLSIEDVEELCQEVFLTAIQRIQSFRGESQLLTWLFRIAVNKAADWRSRRHAAKRGGGVQPVPIQAAAEEGEPVVDPPAPDPQPDEALLSAEQCATLYRALDQLGHSCRELIELRYFGDASYEEIAAVLSLHEKTVSSRLSRCLDRLEVILRPMLSAEDRTRFTV
jgi:RNA polymerase sigma-70 factor, ECF subfamily